MGRAKNSMKRRAFLSKGMAGIAGAVALPHFISDGSPIKRVAQEKKYKMVYRTLGKTGIKLHRDEHHPLLLRQHAPF